MNNASLHLPKESAEAIQILKEQFAFDDLKYSMIAVTMAAAIIEAYDNYTVKDYEKLRSEVAEIIRKQND